MTTLQKQANLAKEALRLAVLDELDKKRRLGQYAVAFQNEKTTRINSEALPSK
jgi:hypothetical protein